MARFQPLEVTDIRHDTRDAVAITLRPPDGYADAFQFTQGQYLTFRRRFDGEELRRSYSICAGKDDGRLQVGIRRTDGGVFSTWANEQLAVGDIIEAMPPMGRFYTPLNPAANKRYLGFAGGSGITPLLSLIKTTLAHEPMSEFTLVYANRKMTSIMFRRELEDLKNIYLERLVIIHVLETEDQEVELFSGRIDAPKLEQFFRSWIDLESVDTTFICGPEPMMLIVAASLRAHGIADEKIKFELFATAQPGRARHPAPSREVATSAEVCAVAVTLDGVTRSLTMAKDGTVVLDAVLGSAIDAPYSCRAGVCSTCRARVLEGEVEMRTNHALEDYEVRAGYILTCQSLPLSDRLVLSYDI